MENFTDNVRPSTPAITSARIAHLSVLTGGGVQFRSTGVGVADLMPRPRVGFDATGVAKGGPPRGVPR